jgi:VanZ family protein
MLFYAFALAVFTGTHWPRLKVPGVEGTDLVLHMTAFTAWTVLAGLCGFFDTRWSRANIGLTCVLALAYAVVDEGLQALPFLGRTASLSDFGADCAGVLTGSLILLSVRRLAGVRT